MRSLTAWESVGLIQKNAKNYREMTDEAAKKLLGDYLAIEEDRVKLKESYLPKLRQVLPEKKVARYLQIENKIEASFRYELADKISLVDMSRINSEGCVAGELRPTEKEVCPPFFREAG